MRISKSFATQTVWSARGLGDGPLILSIRDLVERTSGNHRFKGDLGRSATWLKAPVLDWRMPMFDWNVPMFDREVPVF